MAKPETAIKVSKREFDNLLSRLLKAEPIKRAEIHPPSSNNKKPLIQK